MCQLMSVCSNRWQDNCLRFEVLVAVTTNKHTVRSGPDFRAVDLYFESKLDGYSKRR